MIGIFKKVAALRAMHASENERVLFVESVLNHISEKYMHYLDYQVPRNIRLYEAPSKFDPENIGEFPIIDISDISKDLNVVVTFFKKNDYNNLRTTSFSAAIEDKSTLILSRDCASVTIPYNGIYTNLAEFFDFLNELDTEIIVNKH